MLLKRYMPTLFLWLIALLCLPQLVLAHGMSEADKLAIIEGGNLVYMWLGATHMLTGYDHLLFVFGIIFFLDTFRDIAKYITAFTLGHSVTLIYATFNRDPDELLSDRCGNRPERVLHRCLPMSMASASISACHHPT